MKNCHFEVEKEREPLTVSLMAIEDSMFAISWLNASVVAADGVALEAGAVASVGWDAVGVVVPAEVVLEVGMLQERIHWTQKELKVDNHMEWEDPIKTFKVKHKMENIHFL